MCSFFSNCVSTSSEPRKPCISNHCPNSDCASGNSCILLVLAWSGIGRLGIAICMVEEELCLLGVVLLTGRPSYCSWEMQWRKIAFPSIHLRKGLFKSLCYKQSQQREILFFHSLKIVNVDHETCVLREKGCVVLILSLD